MWEVNHLPPKFKVVFKFICLLYDFRFVILFLEGATFGKSCVFVHFFKNIMSPVWIFELVFCEHWFYLKAWKIFISRKFVIKEGIGRLGTCNFFSSICEHFSFFVRKICWTEKCVGMMKFFSLIFFSASFSNQKLLPELENRGNVILKKLSSNYKQEIISFNIFPTDKDPRCSFLTSFSRFRYILVLGKGTRSRTAFLERQTTHKEAWKDACGPGYFNYVREFKRCNQIKYFIFCWVLFPLHFLPTVVCQDGIMFSATTSWCGDDLCHTRKINCCKSYRRIFFAYF